MPIKWLEKEWFAGESPFEYIKIPVPPITQQWGRPHYVIELYPDKKIIEGQRYFKIIFLGLPHFEKQGYKSWRKVKCKTPNLWFKNAPNGFQVQICKDHKKTLNPVISFYPPDEAKYLKIESLYSGVYTGVCWIDEKGENV